MFSRDMFTRPKIESALRNNVDYISLVLSLVSAILFLCGDFLAHSAYSDGISIYISMSIFSAVGHYSSSAAGVSVFLVIFIVIDFALLIASAGFIAVRVLTEVEVFSDKLEVKLASLKMSPAKIISLAGVIISFVSMIMGGVYASNSSLAGGYYTTMFAPFIFFALSALSAFVIPLIVGKSRRYEFHREASAPSSHDEYKDHHGWNGTENFNDDEK